MVRGIVGTNVSLSFRKRKTGELVTFEARRSPSTPPPDRLGPGSEQAGPRVDKVMSTGASSLGQGGVHAVMWGALLRSNGGKGGFLGCPAASIGSFLLLCSTVGGEVGGRGWEEMKAASQGRLDRDVGWDGLSLQDVQQEYAKDRSRKNAGIVIRCVDLPFSPLGRLASISSPGFIGGSGPPRSNRWTV